MPRPPRSTRTETLIPYTTLVPSAQKRYQHSLESCVFGVERIDVTGRILYANPIYHDILGYGEHELIGENVFVRLQDPVHARALENYIRHVLDRTRTRLNSSHSCATRMHSSA